MADFQSFDPSFYLSSTSNMCESLKSRDYLNTSELVENLYKTIIDEKENLHQGIFSILTETGEGKTFFLALLYCLLKEKSYKVYYVDILHYAIHQTEENMITNIHALCTEDSTIVVLIDNLEKHSPHVVLDFIYRLNVLVRQENILCMLSYDESVLLKKIESVYGGSNDMQVYFQNFIDIEYFLVNKVADSDANMKIFKDIHPMTVAMFEPVLVNLKLTIREKNIIAKKVRFFILSSAEEKKAIEYLPYVFYLTILKLRHKKDYRDLLADLPDQPEELVLYNDVLQPMLKKREEELNSYQEGHGEGVDGDKPILQYIKEALCEMELIHV